MAEEDDDDTDDNGTYTGALDYINKGRHAMEYTYIQERGRTLGEAFVPFKCLKKMLIVIMMHKDEDGINRSP